MDGLDFLEALEQQSCELPYRAIFLQHKARDDLFCIVDHADYAWAMQWRWRALRSKGKAEKWYATRGAKIGGRSGRQVTVFLHKEICLRHRGLPPTEEHRIGDHQDGNSLNNRRGNLDWSTPGMNRQNVFGLFASQLRMALLAKDGSRLLYGKKQPKLITPQPLLQASRLVDDDVPF